MVDNIGSRVWTNYFNNKKTITELLIDCQCLAKRNSHPDAKELLRTIEPNLEITAT